MAQARPSTSCSQSAAHVADQLIVIGSDVRNGKNDQPNVFIDANTPLLRLRQSMNHFSIILEVIRLAAVSPHVE
eukprot:5126200-Pleurochrysis_carterae.AAC.1